MSAAPSAIRIAYLTFYGLIPAWVIWRLLPAPVGVVAAAALVAVVAWRAFGIGVVETPSGVRVRNFWRTYDIMREQVSEVYLARLAWTFWMLSPNSDCLRIRLRDGTSITVIASLGGAKRVNRVLETLEVPVEDDGRIGMDDAWAWIKRRL